MQNEDIKNGLRGRIEGLSFEAEAWMDASNPNAVGSVNSEVIELEKIIQGAAAQLAEIKSRIYNFKTSGSPDIIVRGNNDY